jgi:hypothetical protein
MEQAAPAETLREVCAKAATRKEYVALAIKYLGHRLAFAVGFLQRILL